MITFDNDVNLEELKGRTLVVMQKMWKKRRERQHQKKMIILMVRVLNLRTSNAKNKNDRIVTLNIVWCTTFSIQLIVKNIT